MDDCANACGCRRVSNRGVKSFLWVSERSLSLVFGKLIIVGSDYQDPGMGYLKESASGDLLFERDSKFADKKDRTLRIRLMSENGVESSFAGPRSYLGRGLSDTEIELFKARDSLFDEELYHEVILALAVANLLRLRKRRE